MTLIQFIYRHSVWVFITFTVLALIAFWPNYLVNPLGPHPAIIHIHAIVMLLWCAMLIAQAALIRFKRYGLHKNLGKFSFVLVPLILVSGILVAQESVSGLPVDSARRAANSALMFHSLIAFGLIYGLAMWHRKEPLVHARYMVGTLFPILTPLTDRLIFIHFPSLIPYLPLLEGRPQAYPAGFLVAECILIVLFAIDLRAKKRQYAFGITFLIVLAYHISVMAAFF
jgi:hypothetical protein